MGVKLGLSTRRLIAIVTLVAVDVFLVKTAYGNRMPPPRTSPGFLTIILPMTNALLLTLPRLRGDRAGRAFWGGFQIVGWVAILTCYLMDQHAKQILFFPYDSLRGFRRFPINSLADTVIVYSFFVLAYSPPLFLMAWLVGQLSAWIDRRRAVVTKSSRPEESTS